VDLFSRGDSFTDQEAKPKQVVPADVDAEVENVRGLLGGRTDWTFCPPGCISAP